MLGPFSAITANGWRSRQRGAVATRVTQRPPEVHTMRTSSIGDGNAVPSPLPIWPHLERAPRALASVAEEHGGGDCELDDPDDRLHARIPEGNVR